MPQSKSESWGVVPGPPALSLRRSKARLNIWGGPVRSGKTVHSLIRWLAYMVDAPPGDLLMVGKTEATLMRNILEPTARATDGLFSYSLGSHRASFLGRSIYLVGANDERSEQKIRGMTSAGAYGDEVTLWPKSFFSMLLSRLSVRGAKLFATTNPDSPYHWLKTGFIDRQEELDLEYFSWPLELNTYLDPDYMNALKKEYTGLWYRRFILGEWVSAAGAVFDFFDRALHVGGTPEMGQYVDLACDYGTSNATAVGLFYSQPATLKSWLERTYYYDGRQNRQRTDAEHADAIDEEFADVKPFHRSFILDPSAASFKVELRKRGWKVQDANNEVLDGIRVMSNMLKEGSFKFSDDPSNTVVVKQISGYSWDSRAQAKGEDKPLKQDDHAVDMIRYLLATLYPLQTYTRPAKPNSVQRRTAR